MFGNRLVLIVDDDRPVLELMAAMVGGAGYQTLQAENGAEAVHLAEANPIDLLITDVEMPGLSGPQLIAILEQRGLIARSLLVTGRSDAIDDSPGLRGTGPLLAKPFSSGQLLGRIHALLAR